MATALSSLPPPSNIGINLEEALRPLDKDPKWIRLQAKAGWPKLKIDESASSAYCIWASNSIVLDQALVDEKIGKVCPAALQSYVFEMANLAQRDKFSKLVKNIGKLTPDQFVEQYERLEHQSALTAKAILRKCIPLKDWSKCPMVFITEQFAPYYLMQQAGSHSQRIWNRFKHNFSPDTDYIGTVSSVSSAEKPYVFALLDLQMRKRDPESSVSISAENDYSNLTKNILKISSMDLQSRIHEIERAFD